MPRDASAWHDILSERGGLVNLNRQHTLSDEPTAIGWLRFLVTAQQADTRPLQMGWLGKARVFVNGKPVATVKNFCDPENDRRDPDGRLSLQNDTMDVPLRAGLNDVAIALHAGVHDDLRPQTNMDGASSRASQIRRASPSLHQAADRPAKLKLDACLLIADSNCHRTCQNTQGGFEELAAWTAYIPNAQARIAFCA